LTLFLAAVIIAAMDDAHYQTRCAEPLPATAEASFDNLDEAGYLEANPDIAQAVRDGQWQCGRAHFEAFGHREHRRVWQIGRIEAMRAGKLPRLEPCLRRDRPHRKRGAKYDFLTPDLRAAAAIVPTDNVSENEYDGIVLSLIKACPDGLILDCGAGRRPVYYPNVVNYEIVDYPTTDILGIAEELPFEDNSFDDVLSIAVLEHVRDPFRAAREIGRVLKPGGRLICAAPFLQPLHAFPHHYYNMTHFGLRALFEPSLVVDDMPIIESVLPIFSLSWIVSSWAAGLSGAAREQFLGLSIRELIGATHTLLSQAWVAELPIGTIRELAHGTVLLAHKPHERLNPDRLVAGEARAAASRT
jgi:SAM-dependent methyltransferase